MQPILILSNIIIDDITLANGRHLPHVLGGAATYAAVAARLWWDDVAILAGVGADLTAMTEGQLTAYGLRDEGHLVRSQHTIQSRLVYRPDGSRTETPVHGPKHFATLQATPADIPQSLLPARGTYVFRDLDLAYWAEIEKQRPQLGTLLWELQDENIAGRWAEVAALVPLCDLFSFNLSEARSLLGDTAPKDIVASVLAAGAKAIILRMGAEGALIGTYRQVFHVTPPASDVIDVTGGGNAFCGGFLAGWLLGSGDATFAARRAAASAAHALSQFGPGNPRNRSQPLEWMAATKIVPIREGKTHEPI